MDTGTVFTAMHLAQLLFVSGCFAQNTRVTYTSKLEEVLSCPISADLFSAAWRVTLEGGTTLPLFAYNGDPERIYDGRTAVDPVRYDNFDYEFVANDTFDLVIRNVDKDDGGVYQCTITPGDAPPLVTMTVEVLPSRMYVTCDPLDECPGPDTVISTLPCTCTAYGVRPGSLSVEWRGVTSNKETAPEVTVAEDLFHINSSAVLQPTQDMNQVICVVTGYNDSGIDVSKRSKVHTAFAPPTCDILISFDNICSAAILECNCSGGFPDVAWYSYFDENNTMVHSSSGSNAVVAITGDGNHTFSCRGCNGVNYGQTSTVTVTENCTTSACTSEPCQNDGTCNDSSGDSYTCTCVDYYIGDNCQTPTACVSSPCKNGGTCHHNSTGGDYSCTYRGSYSGVDCDIAPGENCAGHVAGLAVEAVLIAILAGTVGWLVYTLRRNSAEKHRTSDPVDGFAGANNPACMDLHERNTVGGTQKSSSEIPVTNVKTVSMLPGRGLMIYHRALLTTTTGNRDAVVKSLSGNAFLETEKIWSSEISTLQKLQNYRKSKQATVVEILGWCHSVPHMLLLEYVNGGNLMEHLRENFSSQKVHQYGNTKQKRFQVPETGRVENLPRYALDVAKGLKFLMSNQFIHPGLRAQKVLVDLSGRCKIYDFVSSSRAKDLVKFLWIETAPYQWLSPEFLFLGSVAAPGDVWSFGVLMWEIFSYGSPPYLGKDRSEVEACIRREERLPMPQNCPGAVWQLMNRCWDQSADMRPAIGEVASILAAMCHEDKEYDEIPTMKTEV